MTRPQQVILCGEEHVDCDWAAADSDEQELLVCAQAHARRKHGQVLSLDDLRPRLRELRRPIDDRLHGL